MTDTDQNYQLHSGFVNPRAKKRYFFQYLTGPIMALLSPKNLWLIIQYIARMVTFSLLLILHQVYTRIPWGIIPQLAGGKVRAASDRSFMRLVRFLDGSSDKTISRLDLIDLAFRNMKAKKARTAITIGGMAIGVGIIVFLVSIGYGLQELVIARVARLDEMRQADVFIQSGTQIRLNDEALSNLSNIPKVESVLPMISAVGRVTFQNSISDVVVFGVTADYLNQSAIKPVKGRIYDSNELSRIFPSTGSVAGATTESDDLPVYQIGDDLGPVEFGIAAETWVRVYQQPNTQSKFLGFTKRNVGVAQGQMVVGQAVSGNQGLSDEAGEALGRWIVAEHYLYELQACDQPAGCSDTTIYQPILDDQGLSIIQKGFIAYGEDVTVTSVATRPVAGQVLGETDEPADQEATDSGTLLTSSQQFDDYVEIASLSAQAITQNIKQVALSEKSVREAIVNRSMLQLLGLNEEDAVGKSFNVSFVIMGDLLEKGVDRIESVASDYTIIGIIPDDRTPIVYVPFIDLRQLDVVNYSQVKVVATSSDDLMAVRKQIEAAGFVTRSVADTVYQINTLFGSIRTVMLLIGMVALGVAALGMFNTLTVSLLERTHEVGLIKAMGMKSSEVRELFLTESMIMGFYGGLAGIILGWALGKVLSWILSIFALMAGAGTIEIAYVPPSFVSAILILSLIVGLVTGIYPAYRTTKISALNALRYE